MVQEISQSLKISGLSAETFFKLIYIDGAFLRRFHADVNRDAAAAVPGWDATRRRTLTFTTPLDAPRVIQNLVGADAITVAEEQTFSVDPATGAFLLESRPVPQIPGASNFTSSATVAVADCAGGGGCTVTAAVSVTALGPWGLASTIESFMAKSAAESVKQLLDYVAAYVDELRGEGRVEAALAVVAEEAAALLAAPESPCGEFFDAEEAEAAAAAAGPAVDLAALEPETLTEVLGLYLRYLSRSADETNALLRSIDARLGAVEAAAAATPAAERGGWARLATAAWEVMPGGETARQAAMLAGVAAASAALTTLYWRSRRTAA